MKEKYLISLCGKSGAGKSTLANKIVEQLPNSSRIRGDHYLKSKSGNISWNEYFKNDQTDWELLTMHISRPIGTLIETPTFNYDTFTRTSENGNKSFIISKYNIVDALHGAPNADLIIELDIPDGLSLSRIHLRGRENLDSPWLEWVRNHNQTVQINKHYGQYLKLDGKISQDELLLLVMNAIVLL